MGRPIVPIQLHEGGDAMPPGRKGVITFYKELISKCKCNRKRTTIHGTYIDDKFIEGLEFRLNELEDKLF